ncbi:hypothetical protein BGZ51_008733 [Haplosporangium sp. Z 767]|nr:hypothetical protein BGZ50_002259 [Haplosporangium sp. Z 11]KAF9190309.1 hypothetical protein BGZ51_008733 [Haplosporangium sp. Z 767]
MARSKDMAAPMQLQIFEPQSQESALQTGSGVNRQTKQRKRMHLSVITLQQQQQRLARQILSWTLSRSNRLTTFHHHYRVVRQEIHQRSTQSRFSTSASTSLSAPIASPQVSTATPGSSHAEQSEPDTQRNAVGKETSAKRHKWTKEMDDEIIRLHNNKVAWKEIDEKLGLPHSSCYYRYYTALDPNLEAWILPSKKPNMAMLDRLVYLVDVEKQSFEQILTRMLLKKPWVTPTMFAPQEVLDAAAQGTLPEYVAKLAPFSGSTGNGKKTPFVRINKITLINKYHEHKARLARNALRANDELFHKAIRRSVELYGENWKRVATNVDELLGQWMPSAVQKPVSAAKVASVYKSLQKTGINWCLEDDAVMIRKILQLSKEHPDILDILARPFLDKVSDMERDRQQEQQRQLWTKISIALGNHSPGQCKRRWNGLWSLKDNEKSSQSRGWHRFERYQFWLLWKHFSQHHPLEDTTANVPLTTMQDLEAACRELSFSKEIAKWMRHRNEAQCLKYFMSVTNPNLDLGIPHTPEELQELGQRARQKAQARKEETGKVRRIETRASLVDLILSKGAEPVLVKISTISREAAYSVRLDPRQPFIRSDWTEDRIRALYEVVMKAKQGVRRADFEVDWDRVVKDMELRFGVTGTVASATEGSTMADAQQQRMDVIFTPEQCRSCWMYISTEASTPFISTLTKTTAESGGDAKDEADGDDHRSSSQLQNWSDHELQLLRQGVRKFGTQWADVRAQFLPNRDISEIYRTWFSISVPASTGEGRDGDNVQAVTDRLSEPDYVGLLSALDKVGGKTAGKETADDGATGDGTAGDNRP